MELTCPEDVIEQRVSDPSRAAFGKLNSLETYRELRDSGAFSYREMPEPLVTVSSADNTPEESVALIEAALERTGAT